MHHRGLLILFAVAILVAGCHSPTSPTEGLLASTTADHGRLSGVVTIGPNCPGPERPDGCPAQPSAYASRKILVFNEVKSELLFTVDIDSQGLYVIDLKPGKYTVDLKPNGIDRVSGLPAVVEIRANAVTKLDVNIDTGIR
jgi:hypothetical protein